MFSIKNRLPCPSQQKIDKFKKGSMSPKVRLRKIPIIMYSFLLYLSPLYLSSRIFLPAEVSLSMGGCGSAYTEKEGRSPPSPRDFPLLLQESSLACAHTFCKTVPFVGAGMRRSAAPSPKFLQSFFAGWFLQKRFAGLRDPRPRKLSCVKKVSQRAHKEPTGSLTSG